MNDDLALEALCDFLDAVEAGIASAKQRIKEAKGQEPKCPIGSTVLPFDADKIQWIDKENDKGKFQLSENINNLDHKALLAFLNEHIPSKCITSGAYFYWIFQDGVTIGRKLKRK